MPMPVRALSSSDVGDLPVRDRAIVAPAHARAREHDALPDLEELRGGVPAERLEVLRGERLLLLRERAERGLGPAGDVVRAREDDARGGRGDGFGELGDGALADVLEEPHRGQAQDGDPLGLGERAGRGVSARERGGGGVGCMRDGEDVGREGRERREGNAVNEERKGWGCGTYLRNMTHMRGLNSSSFTPSSLMGLSSLEPSTAYAPLIGGSSNIAENTSDSDSNGRRGTLNRTSST